MCNTKQYIICMLFIRVFVMDHGDFRWSCGIFKRYEKAQLSPVRCLVTCCDIICPQWKECRDETNLLKDLVQQQSNTGLVS